LDALLKEENEMPFKIFSEISQAAHKLKVIEGVASDVAEKVRRVFHAGDADIIEDLNRLTHDGGVEATIYATYGYRQNGKWVIPLRGRVHQKRVLPDDLIAGIVAKHIHCEHPDMSTLVSRSMHFTDDSRSNQAVAIEFDSDPDKERYDFPRSDLNGLIEREIELSEEKAQRLLAAQGADHWLAFKVVSESHSGSGRIRLIAPEGVSVVTDIDDTIKVSLIPGDKDEVLRRTLCRDFEAVEGMAKKYRESWPDAAFHYVSGGPWQLYTPLRDFLIEGAGGFPEGSFHLTYHPKNFLAEDTREILIETIAGSLGNTFSHKVKTIRTLMQRFPLRSFVLVGDSGEVDPEVYRQIKDEFPGRVQEIWIRDVLNDDRVNSYRLKGMNVIKVEPVVCATIHHYQKLSIRFQEVYNRPYARNMTPPCGQANGQA
jgi:hypothetical protein